MPLVPFRSVAVDRSMVPLGTWLYIPELGRRLGRTRRASDGCFVADDTGSAIKGRKLDLFIGFRGAWERLRVGPRPTRVRVYLNHPKCAGPRRMRR